MREWARRIPAGEVTFAAMHPGWADTPGISAALPGFYALMGPLLRTPGPGRRHDRLARRRPGRGRRGRDGTPVPRSPAAPVRPRAHDPCLRRRTPAAVGRRGRPHRRRGPGAHHSNDQTTEQRHDPDPRAHRDGPAARRRLRLHRRLRHLPGMGSGHRLIPAPGRRTRRSAVRATRWTSGWVAASRRWSTASGTSTVPAGSCSSGSGSGVDAVDDIRFERVDDRTVIDYTADIRLGGLLRFVQPFLGGTFRKIGRDAAAGHGRDARRTSRTGPTR